MLRTFLVALIMWPLEALCMMVGLSWLNSYWPFVPTIPFFGAVALTFVISTIGTIFRGYANGTEK